MTDFLIFSFSVLLKSSLDGSKFSPNSLILISTAFKFISSTQSTGEGKKKKILENPVSLYAPGSYWILSLLKIVVLKLFGTFIMGTVQNLAIFFRVSIIEELLVEVSTNSQICQTVF